MASAHFLSLQTPLFHFRPRSAEPRRFFPVSLAGGLRSSLPRALASSSSPTPNAVPGVAEQEELLRAVADSDENSLPCVRTFESEAARLTLVGAVDFQQALTAAAADGGRAADEHLESGMPTMVVETVFPGSSADHSTVSTRLFLPARKVKEKARKLRKSLDEDILSSPSSKNILAMTFRQVVIQQSWTFELVMFTPGTERNMEDLGNPREVSVSFTLSSSDERVISVLSEAVCMSILQSTESNFLNNYLGKSSSNLFPWLQNPRRVVSKDSSVIITKLFEDDIVENAKSLLKDFNSKKAHLKDSRYNLKYGGWTPSAHSKLEKIGGPQFCAWISEYIPAYRIQIHADRLKGIKFEGWRKCSEDTWEVLLTNSQMVGLADIIDMYYEDLYTLPNKELSCEVTGNFTNLPSKKRSSFLLKMLSMAFASGIFIVAISALGQLCLPRLKLQKSTGELRSLPASEIANAARQSLDDEELEKFCISAVKTITEGLNWPDDIISERNVGVWTGKLPDYLKMVVQDDSNSEEKKSIPTSIAENNDANILTSAQDIASYQVVFTLDGKLVGFQPTSRVAVNQWSANPLAKKLYGGKNLSPGLLEPGLKVNRPDGGVIVIELLMSTKPDAWFALARPSR